MLGQLVIVIISRSVARSVMRSDLTFGREVSCKVARSVARLGGRLVASCEIGQEVPRSVGYEL